MASDEIISKITRALSLGQSYDAYVLASHELRQDITPALLSNYAQAVFEQGQREESLVAALFTLSLFPDDAGARNLLQKIKNPNSVETKGIPQTAECSVTKGLGNGDFHLWSSEEHESALEEFTLYESSDRTEQLSGRVAISCTVVGAEAIPVIAEKFLYCGGLANLDSDVAIGVVDSYTRALASTGISSLRDVPENPGELLTLVDRWAGQFWHWFTEKLPIVVAAENSGYTGTYLIPPGGNYVVESLALLGISPERILKYSVSAMRCERLLVPDSLPGARMALYPQLFLALRERMLATCDTSYGPLRRVYISRNSNPSLPRRLNNESDLLALIQPYKFECVSLEQLSLREQLSLMSRAEAIIAPHGAGMVHTLFAQKQALVVELFPPDYINPCMLPIIKLLKHKYYMIPSYKNFSEEAPPRGEFYAFLEPIELALQREFKF